MSVILFLKTVFYERIISTGMLVYAIVARSRAA